MKTRIGVVLDTLGTKNTAALRYAVLRLNTLQSFAEFEIVYGFEDSGYVDLMRSGRVIDREEIVSATEAFSKLVNERSKRDQLDARGYFPCDRYLAVCNVTSSDNYYLITTPTSFRVFAVGRWNKEFSPPSLLEVIVHTCVKQAVRQAFANPNSHLSAMGCLFDFNGHLENVRNGVLIGHICSDCEKILNENKDERWRELKMILGGKWLGDPADPYSAFSDLRRLKYQPFQARGVEDSWQEKAQDIVSKALLEKLVGYIVLGIALYFAISFGLDQYVTKL